jgi:hypothetical protein
MPSVARAFAMYLALKQAEMQAKAHKAAQKNEAAN